MAREAPAQAERSAEEAPPTPQDTSEQASAQPPQPDATLPPAQPAQEHATLAPAQPSASETSLAPALPPAANGPVTQVILEPKFGDQQVIVISGQLGASFGFLSFDSSPASTNFVRFEPALDYFVQTNISVGGSLFFRYESSTSGFGIVTKSTVYGAQLRAGFNVPLGKVFSIHVVGTLGVWRNHTTFEADDSGYFTNVGGIPVELGRPVDEDVTVVGVHLPVLIHPVSHFFLGFGPDLYRDISHSVGTRTNRRSFMGASSTIGGWL